MQTIFQILPMILEKAGGDDLLREQVSFALWRKVAGESVTRHAIPAGLDGTVLRVAVTDRTWKTQLEKLAPEYIARMARLAGIPIVRRLEFRIAPAAVRSAAPPTAKPVAFHHTAEITSDLRDCAGAIRDDQLRQIFLHAAARSIERSGS